MGDKNKNGMKVLEDELWQAKKKISVLTEFRVLLDKFYDRFKNGLDAQLRTEYHDLLIKYHEVCPPKNSTPKTTSGPKTVTFKGKTLQSYKVLNTETNKFETRYHVVKDPSLKSTALQTSALPSSASNQQLVQNNTKQVIKVLPKTTVNSKDNCLQSPRLVKVNVTKAPGTTSSSQSKSVVIDLTEDSADKKVKALETPKQNHKITVLNVKSKSGSNVSKVISIKSLGKPKSVVRKDPVATSPIKTAFTPNSPHIPDGRFLRYHPNISSGTHVWDSYKYFNYETNKLEVRWAYRKVKTLEQSKQQGVNSVLPSGASTPVTTTCPTPPKTTSAVNEDSSPNKSENTENTEKTYSQTSFSNGYKIYEYKRPKVIRGPNVRDKYLDPTTKRYACNYEDCDKTYSEYSALRDHINDIHIENNFFCEHPNCGKGFSTAKRLEIHTLCHSDIVIKCDICGQRMSTNAGLKVHKHLKHSQKKESNRRTTFKCEAYKCNRIFRSQLSLLNHKREHLPEPTVHCKRKDCKARFFSFIDLKKHAYDVHTPFNCCDWPGCDYKTKNRFNINEHRKIHTGEKPYACHWQQCGKTFRTKSYLTNHIKVHEKYVKD